jgi:hypothetical protein
MTRSWPSQHTRQLGVTEVRKIPVSLSHPQPFLRKQEEFLNRVEGYLGDRGLAPLTLGRTDYDMDAPLKAIRRFMTESNGLIALAFRRTRIDKGMSRPETDIEGQHSRTLEGTWFTSPWTHIEPAMAYQLGLPILIFREAGVLDDGILEKGVVGLYSQSSISIRLWMSISVLMSGTPS